MDGILTALGFFLSALMQGATGFGSAIGMNAFLTKIIDIKVVTPVIMALTLLLNITMLSRKHEISHFPHLKQLIGWSLVGMPFGYWLLLHVPHYIAVYSILGLIIALFLFQIITHHYHMRFKGWILDLVCFFAGVFGLAYNVTGLFIAIYILSLDLPKDRIIRLTATYFLVVNIIGVSLFWWRGLYTPETIEYIITGTPRIIFGGLAGLRMNTYIPQHYFPRLIRGFLLGSIVLMLV